MSTNQPTKARGCEHCTQTFTGKRAATNYNHHVIWSHTDQDRKLASGRILTAEAK